MKSKPKSANVKSKMAGSVYSLVSCSDLTPGSLDVWLDLPDEIKYDPLLAPFKHRYEEQHGKLDPKDESEGDKTIFRKEAQHGNGVANDSHTETVIGLMEPMAVDDEKQKTSRKRKVTRALRVVKLTALVAGWLLLTVALLLNREKSDVVLHTAVIGGQIKEYELSPSNERVKVLITLTGPFDQTSVNRSSNVLELWLNRDVNDDEFQQDSPKWSIVLPEDELIDFSPSATESQILILEGSDLSSNGSRNGTDWGKGINGTRVTLRLNTSSSTTVPLTVSYQLDPLDHEVGLLYATALLLVLYFLIIFEIVNRTLAALLSSSFGIGVLAWGGARPTLEELVSWLDAETLLLLFSMMLLVAILAETGLFDYLAVTAYELTGGRTWPLINCLCLFTAIFSTFLDNVTTVLLMTPVTIRLCEVMELNPVPVLMSMVIFSNVGGAATPVGDPPNVIIATNPSILQANINFSNFTLHMGVGILLVAVQTYLQLRYMYRDISKLRHSVPWDIQEMRQEIAVWRRACASLSNYSRDEDIVRRALEKKVDKLTAALVRRESKGGPSRTDPRFCSTLATMKQKYRIRDKQLLIKAAVCVSFVVVVFFLHAIPELQRLSLGWTALLGALLLLLLAEREDLEPILARVEWSTLLFFAALFVMMETLSKLGLIQWIGNVTETLILRVAPESRLAVALMLVLWCVLPVNTYGAETWTLTVGLLHQFKVAQRAMERAMLEVSLKDWIRNEYIRQRTKLSGIASAFVDNIPLSTMMVRVVVSLSAPGGLGLPLAPLAWALSFGACLGGNGTLIGASANVVCAGVAEQHGYRFTFLQFLKIGFPIMIGNLIVASVYLLFCHCVFEWH